MMRFALLPLLLLVLVASCSFASADDDEPPQDAVSPDEVLRRSDEAMDALLSFRVTTRVVPSVAGNPPYETAYDIRGRSCVLPAGQMPQVQPNGACPCGEQPSVHDLPFFNRAKGGQPFGPPFAGGTLASNLRLEREETLDGRRAWVLSYEFKTPSIEGPFTIWRSEWIDKETYLLLRQEQTDDDRFGVRAQVTSVLSHFDALPFPACR